MPKLRVFVSIVKTLRAELAKLQHAREEYSVPVLLGVDSIDAILPKGGLSTGALHEVAAGGPVVARGAAAALFAAGVAAKTGGTVLWCMKHADLFAPALEQAGLPLSRLLFVETRDEKNLLACMEEGLRHGGLSCVVGEVGKLPMTASRRLQLAAESTGTMGIVLRRFWTAADTEQLNQPTAAVTRWRVSPLPSVPLPVRGIGRAQWKLELLRCRSGVTGQWNVEAWDETGHIALSAGMVDHLAAQILPLRGIG